MTRSNVCPDTRAQLNMIVIFDMSGEALVFDESGLALHGELDLVLLASELI